MSKVNYQQAGVNIERGNAIVDDIKQQVKATFSPAVLTDIGSFGSLYDLKTILDDYQQPVLVQSIDGLGTKPIIARMMNQYDTLGTDILSATSNDIVVLGAKPLNLLDYIASDQLEPSTIKKIITGLVQACQNQGVSLIGGETAEMPNVYAQHEHDVVGVITGIVDKEKIITGSGITVGDKVFAMPSSGLHTNGYSLARKILFEIAKFPINHHLDELQQSIGEALLQPHLNYQHPIAQLLAQGAGIKGMAHITGGGIIENIPRILPEHCGVVIRKNACPIPPIFTVLQQIGKLEQQECYRTFNMGMGLILIGEQNIQQYSETTLYEVGEVVNAPRTVTIQ